MNELQDQLEAAQRLIKAYEKILRHVFPERSGMYFISGESGQKDAMGLPEYVTICPEYGCDGFAVYTKTSEYTAPGW